MSAIFLLLVGLLAPTQLGLHFWPAWTNVYGLPVDFLSPTLYLSDLLLIAIFFFNLPSLLKVTYSHRLLLLPLFLFLCLNLLNSLHPLISLLALLRYLLLTNLFLYITRSSPLARRFLLLGLASSLIIITTLALLQFQLQGSLDGFAYWLGERHFQITTPGIARTSLFGSLYLRPYSTFSHPNSLAGYLLLSLLLLSFFRRQLKNYLLYPALFLGLITLFLTASKAALVTFIILLLVHSPSSRLFLSSFSFFFLGFIQLLPLANFSPVFVTSINQRLFLAQDAVRIISRFPLFGAGLNTFVYAQGVLRLGFHNQYLYLQPVHHLLLLLLSQIGFLGLAVLIFCLYYFRKAFLPLAASIFAIVLFTGSLDHYWLTLPQNRLLLTLALALVIKRPFPVS